MRIVKTVLILPLLIVCSCTTKSTNLITLQSLSEDEIEVGIAFIQSMVPEEGSEGWVKFLNNSVYGREAKTPKGNKIYVFLSLKELDPSDDLLKRFERNDLVLRKGSEFKVGAGIRLYISELIIEGDLATIDGGYFVDGLSAQAGKYTLKRVDGVWLPDEVVFELIA